MSASQDRNMNVTTACPAAPDYGRAIVLIERPPVGRDAFLAGATLPERAPTVAFVDGHLIRCEVSAAAVQLLLHADAPARWVDLQAAWPVVAGLLRLKIRAGRIVTDSACDLPVLVQLEVDDVPGELPGAAEATNGRSGRHATVTHAGRSVTRV